MKFYITIQNRIAEVLSDSGKLPLLVCDNTDNSVTFLFDSEWDAYPEKTARFVYRETGGKGALVYRDVSFYGSTVAAPLLHNVKEVYVGVIAGSLVTTSAARISCVSSVYGFSADPAGTEGTEAKTVELNLADGDQIVTPSAGKTLSSVVITKPTTLLPEHIRAGVMIAGVIGTYRGGEDEGADGESGEGAGDSEPTSLSTPVISLSGYTVVISKVEHATGYRIYVNGDLRDTIEAIQFSLADYQLANGTHTVSVRAYYDGTAGEILSDFSNEVTYTVYDIPAPQIELNGTVLKIYAVENVKNYEVWRVSATGVDSVLKYIQINSGEYTTTDLSSVLSEGENQIYVIAKSGTSVSEPSTILTIEYLSEVTIYVNAPVLSIDGSILTVQFQGGSSAATLTNFSLFCNGTCEAVIGVENESSMTMDLDVLKLGAGEYNVTVSVSATATIDGKTEVVASPESNAVSYIAPEPADDSYYYSTAPSISLNGTVMTITPPEGNIGVSFYRICCESYDEFGSTSSTALDLTTVAAFTPGETYTVYVYAYNMEYDVTSQDSNTITYTAPSASTSGYKLTFYDEFESGATVQYAKNKTKSTISGGSYDGEFTADSIGYRFSGIEEGDYLYLYLPDEYQSFSVIDVDGCTASVEPDGMHSGAFLKLHELIADATVTVRVYTE